MDIFQIEVAVISDPKVGSSIGEAVVLGEFGQELRVASGGAKVHGPDKFDASIGNKFAVARSLRALADGLEHEAQEEVDRLDGERAERRAKNEKALAKKQSRKLTKSNANNILADSKTLINAIDKWLTEPVGAKV